MNYRKRTLKGLIISLSLVLVLVLSTFGVAFAETQYVKIYDKEGNTIKHYGTYKEVEMPRNYLTAEYEMRGVWVATVYNIAISRQEGTTPAAIEKYKQEFISILDRMEEYNMNTLYFQVRPSNDAFYQSVLNPWSQFLAGAGVDPGWDPLEWMVTETHKRGFVFQCWMNAFRVTVYSVLPGEDDQASEYTNSELLTFKKNAISKLDEGNFARLNPDCVVMGETDTRLILNPSDPRVQEFLVATCKEIIENYDVDGFHFDDYFYLSGGGAANNYNGNFAGGKNYDASLVGENTLNDLPCYEAYKNGDVAYAHLEKGLNLGDFRRASLNHMIKSIRLMVDKYNEEHNDVVEFGAKPAAVWRSNIEFCRENEYRCTENGSNTHASAYSSYNDLYADTLTWVKEGWVDYMAPQVYYGFSSTEAPYADIVMWWAEQIEQVNAQRRLEGKKDIKLYIAHGIYKYRDDKKQFALASEIKNQLYYNQKFDSIVGSAFYSYENLYKFVDKTHENGMKLVKQTWSEKVIPIPVGENDAKGLMVEDIKIRNAKGSTSYSLTFDLLENVNVYAVYKVKKGETLDTSDVTTRSIVEFEGYQEGKSLSINIDDYDPEYDYYFTVFSKRYHMSDEIIKLDFNSSVEYTPLTVEDSIELDSAYPLSTNISFTLTSKYEEARTLTYSVYVEYDGDERLVASGEVVNDTVNVTWKSWPFATMSNRIKVVYSDGVLTETVYSNYFDVANVFNITYDLNGVEATLDAPNVYVEGKGVETLPTPTEIVQVEGKKITFDGWVNEAGQKVTSIGIYQTGNVKLKAKWIIETVENPNPAPQPSPNGGCSCSSTSASVVISALTALSLAVLVLRKNK